MSDPILMEEPPVKPVKKSRWGRFGVFITFLAMLTFICAFAYGYFELSKVNLLLAKMVGQLQQQAQQTQTEVVSLKEMLTNLQQSLQKSEDLSSQQEKLLADWESAQQGNLKKWYLAEAQYLIRLANDQVQFTHNIPMALTLLQRAEQVVQGMKDESLIDVRKSLADDIAALQAIPEVDTTDLFIKLTTLNNQVEKLPLPLTPISADKRELTQVTPGLPWWKQGLQRTWTALQHVVIVRYNGSNTLPLILPEEKIFLYQNLHAQFESAIWGVLHRNATVYQGSLTRMTEWIKTYFVQDAQETKGMLEGLAELQKVDINLPDVSLSDTLKLLNENMTKAEPSKPAQ